MYSVCADTSTRRNFLDVNLFGVQTMCACVCCADTRLATVVHTTHSVHECVCVLRCWCEENEEVWM